MLKRNDPHLNIQAPDLKQQLNPLIRTRSHVQSLLIKWQINTYIEDDVGRTKEVCLILYIKYKTFCRHLIIVTPKVEVIDLHARSPPPGCPNQFVTNCWVLCHMRQQWELFLDCPYQWQWGWSLPYLLFWALMMWTVYRILHMHAT